MPDRLSRGGRSPRRAWVEFVLTVLPLAVAGLVGALIWYWVWTPPVGVASGHKWLAEDEAGLQAQFSATGWYVVVASAAGLLVGILVALFLDRVPLLTLAAVIVGSVLGTFLMLRVGAALGPSDPHTLALHAADGTHLPGQLEVSERSPWIALPAGALVGLALVFIGLTPRRKTQVDDIHVG